MKNNRKKLLIINRTQFGYHTDYYKYCEHLRTTFDISYICFDSGHKKLMMDKIDVMYVNTHRNKALRGILFFFKIILSTRKCDLVLIKYFPWCSWVKKYGINKRMILDIRTLSVNPNKIERLKEDANIKRACSKFDFVTVISEGVQNKLSLNKNKSAIVPLGADIISDTEKKFNELRLLYVGTFYNRKLEKTLEGLSLFLKRYPKSKITYDIVGFGSENEELELKNSITNNKLQGIVKFHGRIPHFELQAFFDNANIGISFVPITDYYEFQPVTKTFEYILSGMVCLATNTYENRKVIDKTNGILCEDTPIGVAQSLEVIMQKESYWDTLRIRKSLENYSWPNIVNNSLLPVLKKIQ